MKKLITKSDGSIRGYDLRKPPVQIGYTLMFVFCIVALLISLMPIIWILLAGFKENKEFVRGVKGIDNRYRPQFLPVSFSLEGYETAWREMKFYRFYLNSLWVVLGSAVSAVLFNGLIAYVISRLKPRGHKIVYGLIMGSLMLPATTSMVPLLVNIRNLGLIGSFLPLWLAIGANAFYVVLFKNFYDSMPSSLLEAARLDGCNDLNLFFRIVMPLSMPINFVILIYAVTAAWSDFLLPYLVLSNTPLETVMVRLFTYRTSDRVNDMDVIRAIVFAIIPPILLFIAFQRKITQNVISAGIKG